MTLRNSKRGEVGPASAGQSGDTQDLPDVADADSDSGQELAEEGNASEADAVQGIEEAKPPDVSEVTTREGSRRRCSCRVLGYRRGRRLKTILICCVVRRGLGIAAMASTQKQLNLFSAN
jgi:hypothetical protein